MCIVVIYPSFWDCFFFSSKINFDLSVLQLASKIQPDSDSSTEDSGRNGCSSLTVKRPFSSTSPQMENEPDAKRMAAAVAVAAAAAAAAAAAGGGDHFGALRSPGMPGGGRGAPMMGMPSNMMAGLGPVSSEEISVPDKMVGLSE